MSESIPSSNLAKKIMRHLNRAYPNIIEIPIDWRKDPRFVATMYELRRNGYIETGSISRTITGTYQAINVNRACSTFKGVREFKLDWTKWIQLIGTVILATSAVIGVLWTMLSANPFPSP